MATTYYPDITQAMLIPIHLVLDIMADDPLALERPACRYPPEVVASLRALWTKVSSGGTAQEVVPIAGRETVAKLDALDEELTQLLDSLRGLALKMDPNDTKEQLNYFRTATALIAKLTDLQERMANVKEVGTFHAKVISVFDDILTPEQRTQAMEKLDQ